MIKRNTILFFILFSLSITFFSCEKPIDDEPSVVLATDDPKIGAAFDREFINYADTASDVKLYSKNDYYKVYEFVDSVLLKLLNTGQITHRYNFTWQIRVFDKIGLETAFVAPGGYIYISKGLFTYLNNEADFAGVIAHAVTIIDKRIITKKLEDEFSVSYLLDLALGGETVASEELWEEIIYAPYSEEDANIIDSLSREMICQTEYDIRSYSTFLARAIQSSNNGTIIEWVQLFPHTETWGDNVYASFDEYTCNGITRNASKYDNIKLTLNKK